MYYLQTVSVHYAHEIVSKGNEEQQANRRRSNVRQTYRVQTTCSYVCLNILTKKVQRENYRYELRDGGQYWSRYTAIPSVDQLM